VVANAQIKQTAIVMSGYLYQNLFGIELLCDWLDNPAAYEWVEFEADEEGMARGLDDIIAKRRDGSFVLSQVKFTVSPSDEQNALSWKWLTDHKPRGRSLIQKWCASFESEALQPVADCLLVTNRLPDRAFASSLSVDGAHVNLSRLSGPTIDLIVAQLGSRERAESFFTNLRIRHSEPDLLSLRGVLLNRVVPRYTDYHGWHALMNATIDWAVRRNFPSPSGRITLEILRQTLDSRRPQALEQTFRVPEGYLPPDAEFHDNFCRKLISGDSRSMVLWGSPGQGKSTYVSYLCRWLETEKLPYVRHHYFLNLLDSSERFSLSAVANSLMHQMEVNQEELVSELNDAPERLRDWLAACGAGYSQLGKRFFVFIDGLDHVWRDTAGSREPLEALFRYLLPLPENVVLVMGTQRVSDEQLPSRLLQFVPDRDWIELPLMSITSTRSWLAGELEARQADVPADGALTSAETIGQLAVAFHEVSKGHPLHLTYSFEALLQRNAAVTVEEVLALPACPDGDIRTYYRSLWLRLSNDAKDALHLIAHAEYLWPRFGLEDALSLRADSLKPNIGHMLRDEEAGLLPFHGSLPAFVREVREHSQRIDTLAPEVTRWLASKAPVYHCWGWLWLYEARCGSNANLINGPSREWALESLAKAYPLEQILRILSKAERAAFDDRQFARAVRLRWLKTRLLNGPEQQLQEFERVYQCALTLTDDGYPLLTESTDLRSAEIGQLSLLGHRYVQSGRQSDAVECLRVMRARLQDAIESRVINEDSYEAGIRDMVVLGAATGKNDREALLPLFLDPERGATWFSYFARELTTKRDLDELLAWLPCSLPNALQMVLEVAILRVAGAECVRLHELPEFRHISIHPLSECWARLYSNHATTSAAFDFDVSVFDTAPAIENGGRPLQHYLHGLFFHVVAKTLEVNGADPAYTVPILDKRKWLSSVVSRLIRSARTAGTVLSRKERPAFNFLFTALRDVESPKDFEEHTDEFAFHRALLTISDDLFLLSSGLTGKSLVESIAWNRATESPHFSFALWLQRQLDVRFSILKPAVTAATIEAQAKALEKTVSVFNERADRYLELCELACNEGLLDVGRELLRHTLSCVAGYGWRKDGSMHLVLSALDCLSESAPKFVTEQLQQVVPLITAIDKITDGSGTTSAKYGMAELLVRLMPRSYAAYYESLMISGEWHVSEQVFARGISAMLQTELGKQLVGPTVWFEDSIDSLKSTTDPMTPWVEELLSKNATFLGTEAADLGKGRSDEVTASGKSIDIDVTAYPPTEAGRLLDAIRDAKIYVEEDALVRKWFDYWIAGGETASLLRSVTELRNSSISLRQLAKLFDELFHISLRLEGKRKAYAWLVAAQVHRNSWEHYYDEAEAQARFAIFSEHYRERWADFLIDTSSASWSGASEQLVIPNDRLVSFLIAVGQQDEAELVASEMVSAVIEEADDQPLFLPTWFSGD
jgi:hypothetical protein